MAIVGLAIDDPITADLIAAGIIPKLCRDWCITARLDEAVTIHSTHLVTREEFEKLAAILKSHGKRLAHRPSVIDEDGGEQMEVTPLGVNFREFL